MADSCGQKSYQSFKSEVLKFNLRVNLNEFFEDSVVLLMLRVFQSEGNQIYDQQLSTHWLIGRLDDIFKQLKVMEAFFRIPEEYWSNILLITINWETNQRKGLLTLKQLF